MQGTVKPSQNECYHYSTFVQSRLVISVYRLHGDSNLQHSPGPATASKARTLITHASQYRAFSRDIMLSSYSNGNQYSFMQASFYIIVRNGFSMNFSICVVQMHEDHMREWCTWLPWISRFSLRNPTAMLENSMTSKKTLYSHEPVVRGLLNKRWWPPQKWQLNFYSALWLSECNLGL